MEQSQQHMFIITIYVDGIIVSHHAYDFATYRLQLIFYSIG